MRVGTSTTTSITDCLTGRPHYVQLGSALSEMVMNSTGAPQGTSLSAFLFTLCTSHFSTTESCRLQRFS